MDPEKVLQNLRRSRRFAVRDIYDRGRTVDQISGGSGQGRGTNSAIIMDKTNLTHDGLARNAGAEIYDPRISRAVTVLHETGHATGAVPYSRESGHAGRFGGEDLGDDPDKINNKIGVACFPGSVQPK